ncbi:hypothetical protein O181_018266 [Austropuccinia psidii MF-1]|uniref:Uncharacterized protein n=1 Tax=Austropuccinia psidii MF-1 TaxID=1389203 RepID=A0A9Q3C9A6_9BASI|nr:hypothetical protein [Austropuccinia psidii MF-1]
MPTLTYELAFTSPPNPLRPLKFLCSRTVLTYPQDVTLIPPPSPPSPLLTPPHPHLLQSLHSHGALKISLQFCHLISALTPPYTTTPLPLLY